MKFYSESVFHDLQTQIVEPEYFVLLRQERRHPAIPAPIMATDSIASFLFLLALELFSLAVNFATVIWRLRPYPVVFFLHQIH